MAVVGLDIGSNTSCFGIARRGGIDMVTSETDARETPTLVSFDAEERHVGETAAPLAIRNAKNTIRLLKSMIGRKFDEDGLQAELQKYNLPFKIIPGEDGRVAVQVMYGNEQRVFSAEQVLGMFFSKAAKTVAAFQSSTVGASISTLDCVVSVPGYFTDSQRRAIIDSAHIGGVNVHRVVNDTTAAALQYGFYRLDLPEKEPIHVVFVDIGYVSMQVSVVDFVKDKLTVKSYAHTKDVSGRLIDEILVDYFAGLIMKKYHLDIKSNLKATVRLRQSAEKVKKILSVNPEAQLNVECIMEDTDVSLSINRDVYEELLKGMLSKVKIPCKQAVTAAGLSIEDISSVEVVGNSSRVPYFKTALEEYFKKEVSRQLNAAEAVAKGTTLLAAIISPQFKVRDFTVVECVVNPIRFSWTRQKDGEVDSNEVYAAGASYPSTKMLTFYRNDTFSVSAAYAKGETETDVNTAPFGTFTVNVLSSPESMDETPLSQKIKIKVRLTENGTVDVAAATFPPAPEPTPEPEPAPEAEPAAEAAPKTELEPELEPADEDMPELERVVGVGEDEGEGAEPMVVDSEEKKEEKEGEGEESVPMQTEETEDAANKRKREDEEMEKEKEKEKGKGKEEEKEKEEKKKKKRIIKTPLQVTSVTASFTETQLNKLIEEEGKMSAHDNLIIETNNAKNAFEEYIYDMRDKISSGGMLVPFMKAEDRDKFNAACSVGLEWLDSDEAWEATKTTFVKKLKALRELGDPAVQRYQENYLRPAAVAEMTKKLAEYAAFVSSNDKKYEHIDAEERAKVTTACKEVETEFNAKLEQQSNLPSHDNPAISVMDIHKMMQNLENTCRPIINKPVPPPPAATPPEEKEGEKKEKEGEKKEGEGEGEPMVDEGESEGEKKEGEGEGEGDDPDSHRIDPGAMDLD